MKNIVYLLRSTRGTKVRPSPLVYPGITNYLYRQLLIHNHRWKPKEPERRRNPCQHTLGKLGWQPMAAIVGFPSENHAVEFHQCFEKEYDNMGVPSVLFRNPRCPVTQMDYRAQQLMHITMEYVDKYGLSQQTANYQEGVQTETSNSSLTIHWDSTGKSLIERLQLNFHPDIKQVYGNQVDVAAIDKICYDTSDEDDDRNYHRLRDEREAKERNEKLMRMARELNIPLEQVESVLRESREAAVSSARFTSSRKHAKKSRIFLSKPIPVVEASDIETLSSSK